MAESSLNNLYLRIILVEKTAPQEQSVNLPGRLCGLCKWQSLLCCVSTFCFCRGENSSAGSINKKKLVEF